MQKWEYKTAPLLPSALEEILNNWGDEGFELVSVVDMATPDGRSTVVGFFKRPKE